MGLKPSVSTLPRGVERSEVMTERQCEWCDYTTKHRQNLSTHRRSCKRRPIDVDPENNQLRERVASLEQPASDLNGRPPTPQPAPPHELSAPTKAPQSIVDDHPERATDPARLLAPPPRHHRNGPFHQHAQRLRFTTPAGPAGHDHPSRAAAAS